MQCMIRGQFGRRASAGGMASQPSEDVDHGIVDHHPRSAVVSRNGSGDQTIARGREVAMEIVYEADAFRRGSGRPAADPDITSIVFQSNQEWPTADRDRIAVFREELVHALDEGG